jgi:acyl CoA:acetate/3-ketoacid CoA transferase
VVCISKSSQKPKEASNDMLSIIMITEENLKLPGHVSTMVPCMLNKNQSFGVDNHHQEGFIAKTLGSARGELSSDVSRSRQRQDVHACNHPCHRALLYVQLASMHERSIWLRKARRSRHASAVGFVK